MSENPDMGHPAPGRSEEKFCAENGRCSTITAMPRPAESLEGLELNGTWTVGQALPRNPQQTGGHFSSAYTVVAKNGKQAFLKAMDYQAALNSPDPAAAINFMTSAYLFEREILELCTDRKMSRVVRAIESGKIIVSGSPVEYLIFELADRGDIRNHLSSLKAFDLDWTLTCIHSVLVGMQQLQGSRIAHQDLKPSNILVFTRDGEKIADLGRAWHNSTVSPHDSLHCAGDLGYAPPELLYGYTSPHDEERRFGADFYLVGSIITFLFTGLRASAFLFSELDPAHQPINFNGSYQDVLPYLKHAFALNLITFRATFLDQYLGAQISEIVGQMCDPDLSHRGDRRHTAKVGTRFSYQRFISQLDRLRLEAKLGRIKHL